MILSNEKKVIFEGNGRTICEDFRLIIMGLADNALSHGASVCEIRHDLINEIYAATSKIKISLNVEDREQLHPDQRFNK